MAGSRTRINYLEAGYADRYTTIVFMRILFHFNKFSSKCLHSTMMAMHFLEKISWKYHALTGI